MRPLVTKIAFSLESLGYGLLQNHRSQCYLEPKMLSLIMP